MNALSAPQKKARIDPRVEVDDHLPASVDNEDLDHIPQPSDSHSPKSTPRSSHSAVLSAPAALDNGNPSETLSSATNFVSDTTSRALSSVTATCAANSTSV